MIIQGNCLDKLKELPDNSVDAVVTDPPYGLSFMGKKWDYDVPSQEIWEECLRVLKPGGYLLAFAGTRTQHRMAVRIEDAGFEIRDMIAWVYGSGFPKSLNIGKAVDKLQGNEREVIGDKITGKALQKTSKTGEFADGKHGGQQTITETKGTSEWEGWGTALKPALEPITVARKPLSEKTVAENALKWGTGGINIDGSRVEYNDGTTAEDIKKKYTGNNENNGSVTNNFGVKEIKMTSESTLIGRFPANLIHDGSDEVTDCFPNDSQRFFYCAKASKSERNMGCDKLPDLDPHTTYANDEWSRNHLGNTPTNQREPVKNNHPTVKPIALMKYLCKLVTPKNGTVLDPFMGSGTTGIACKVLGFEFIGIEIDGEYINIAQKRIDNQVYTPQLL